MSFKMSPWPKEATAPTKMQRLNRVLLRTLMREDIADIVAERLEEVERELEKYKGLYFTMRELDSGAVEKVEKLELENAALREKLELLEKPKAERIWFLIDPKSKEAQP